MSEQAPAVETSTPANPAAPVTPVVEAPATPPAEQPKVEAKPETKIEVDESVSKHFAELKRRQAAFEAEKKQHTERVKADEADRKAFEEWRTNRDAARKDPVKAFGLLGMTADDVAKALYEAPQQPTEVQALRGQLEQLQAKLDADNKAREDAVKAERDAANRKAIDAKITEHLAKPDYELTRARGRAGSELVFDVMTAYWQQRGEVLDFDKACEAVEKHYEAEADSALSTEKYKRKLAAKADEAKPPKKEEAKSSEEKKPAPADPKVVLSNKTSADMPPGSQPPTDADHRARAVRVLKERIAARQAAGAPKKGA